MNTGVISMGIQCPIIRQNDNLVDIVVNSVLNDNVIEDNDIIGITESIVARCEGNYVTVDDIAKETERIFGKDAVIELCFPIYSRNRFSMILKGIARACKAIIFMCPPSDEVGNPYLVNPWTGVNIKDYYRQITESENCEFVEAHSNNSIIKDWILDKKFLICRLHKWNETAKIFGRNGIVATLADYFKERCQYGLLGSNKANEETLKLFPSRLYSETLVNSVQSEIEKRTGKHVEVMIYGDGCFKDPDSGIWEFADPVASPAYTPGLNGSPNEIKLKAFADDKYKNLKGKELEDAIKLEIANKENNLTGNMNAQGTTPRRYINLLASLMDLTSGSGDRGTPVVLVKNYFKNYSNA